MAHGDRLDTDERNPLRSLQDGPLQHDTPERIGPGNRIEHKPLDGELQVVEPFLPEGTLRVGITSGASTPDRVVEDVISRLIDLADA